MTIAMPLLREPGAGRGGPAQPCPIDASGDASGTESRAEAARRLRCLARQLRTGGEAGAGAPATILALFER